MAGEQNRFSKQAKTKGSNSAADFKTRKRSTGRYIKQDSKTDETCSSKEFKFKEPGSRKFAGSNEDYPGGSKRSGSISRRSSKAPSKPNVQEWAVLEVSSEESESGMDSTFSSRRASSNSTYSTISFYDNKEKPYKIQNLVSLVFAEQTPPGRKSMTIASFEKMHVEELNARIRKLELLCNNDSSKVCVSRIEELWPALPACCCKKDIE